MSSSQPGVEIKGFPPLDQLDVSPTAMVDDDADASLIKAETAALHGFSIDSASDSINAGSPQHNLMDASHFGDFQFPYQGIQDESTIVAIPEDSAPELFASPQRASVSSAAGGQESISSITARVPNFGNAPDPHRVSAEASDAESPDSHMLGANSLEEPMSDEFGLSINGPSDGTDLGVKPKEDKVDTAPAWSELKTKAGKERKRLPLACIACRRKKIRCSGEKPACKHCLRSRIPCVYKVTARKAAPRTDYMAMLDKRLKRMEERIIKIVPKPDQENVTANIPRAVVRPALPGNHTAGKGSAKKRGADEAFGPDLEHWARGNPKGGGSNEAARPRTLVLQESEDSKLLREGAEALPPKAIQEHLAEVFFDHIYGQAYHLLHKPSYMRKLRAGTLPPVLILSVCAVSARFSTHPELDNQPKNFLRGEEWASHARAIVMKNYEWPNITTLTCLLILGLHEFGTCHGGRSWALGGQAIRMAFALQLHKDLDQDPIPRADGSPLSFVDREIRRRTMWACFLMDRFNSSGTDRPTFVKEEAIKIQLPVKESCFQLDMPRPTEDLNGNISQPLAIPGEEDQLMDPKENMGVAAYMIKAIAVWGRIINHLNQGGKDLDPHPMWDPESGYAKLAKQADDMLASLPDLLTYSADNLHLHNTTGMANQFLFLHIAIQQSILFLNRFAVSSPNDTSQQDVPKAFVTKAGAKAFSAANRISELLKEAEPFTITAPFVGYCAFLSGTVHIFGVFSNSPAMEATSKRNLSTNVKFLGKMKRYWGMFHFMLENLREQYKTCADAKRQGTAANENSASPIFQYGDWFDRYPHGYPNVDLHDPISQGKKKDDKSEEAVMEQKPELHTVEELLTRLSPKSREGREPAVSAPTRPLPVKRKSTIAKKAGSSASRAEQQHLEPLLTDLHHSAAAATAEQIQMQQQLHHRRHFSGSLGGQTSGPTNFNPLTIPTHSGTAGGSSFHHHQAAAAAAVAATLSPISPVGHHQFGHHPHPHFYPPELLLSLQHAGGMLPQLDRQLVHFGAYGGLDPSGLGGNNVLVDSLDWPGGLPSAARDAAPDGGGGGHRGSVSAGVGGSSGSARGAGPGAGDGPAPGGGGASSAVDGLPAFGHMQGHGGHETSSAWFMPFNMEPPELGPEMAGMGSLDHFASMFGGMGAASGSGGGGQGGGGAGGGTGPGGH